MKRKYYWHRSDDVLNESSVVYVVWVGSSVRDVHAAEWMRQYAEANGGCFVLWSDDVDVYLNEERRRVFPNASELDFGFIRAELSVIHAKRLTVHNEWEVFEKRLVMPKDYFRVKSILNHKIFFQNINKIKKSLFQREKRKYLSHGDMGVKSVVGLSS